VDLCRVPDSGCFFWNIAKVGNLPTNKNSGTLKLIITTENQWKNGWKTETYFFTHNMTTCKRKQ